MQRVKSVAVVGAGISGLSTAWLLSKSRDVTLYEREPRLGGHSDTFDWDGLGVDCGFIVYNERTYPNLTALFQYLSLATEASDMSFAVSVDDGDFEYSGSGLRGLIAQKANVLRPRYWSMLRDILRFFREAPRDLAKGDLGPLGAYLDARGYGRAFRDDYLYPMAAAIWSTPAMRVADFPAANFIRFNANHGLLDVTNRPIWRTVAGGSRSYVGALAAGIGEVRTTSPVRAVRRTEAGVEVVDAPGEARRFDDVVIAAHADAALAMIEAPTAHERRLLGAFAYLDNQATLHTDARAMPKRRAAWSSWNYMAKGEGAERSLYVSYWMNRLQQLPGRPDAFLTLNCPWEIPSAKVLRRVAYRHPLFDAAAFAAQKELWSLQGAGGLWFCGAYFGYGFHEDGLQSGLAVAEAIGGEKRPWRVAGESDRLHLGKAGAIL
jgi:predicted NAD/FAD-binding protein